MVEKLNYYEFSQNNSGGYFDDDENVGASIIIEEYNVEAAIAKAEELTENGSGSCDCCGDRWSFWTDEDDKIEFPNVVKKTDYDESKLKERFKEFPNVEFIGKQEYFGYACNITVEDIESYAKVNLSATWGLRESCVIHKKDGTVIKVTK